MGAMTVRNLDPKVVERLRMRAAEQKKSLNVLVCEILAQAAEDDARRRRLRAVIPRMDRLRAKIAKEFPNQTPSEILIREDRDR